jgi:hypothetical protein
MLRITLFLLCSASLIGCDSGIGLGERCYFGCVVDANSASGSCSPEIRSCEDDLYCSLTTNSCEVPSKRGELCGEQCEQGLICRFDGRCGELSREDETCLQDTDCVAELSCNWGVDSSGVEEVGHCKPSQGEGGPCSWQNGGWGALAEATKQQSWWGCKVDLVCTPNGPGVLGDALNEESATRSCMGLTGGCAYAGTCRRPGRGAVGEPCIDNRTCMSGRCYIPKAPRIAVAALLTSCQQIGADPLDTCYPAPWTGYCIDDTHALEFEVCDLYGGTCAPQLVCTSHNTCRMPYSEGLDGSCGAGDGPDETPHAAMTCGIGLSCQFAQGSWRCL